MPRYEDEEKTTLLDNPKTPDECLCASLLCFSAAVILIVALSIMAIVVVPIGWSHGRSYIRLQYIFQGTTPTTDVQNVIFGAVQTWTEYIYALDHAVEIENGTHCGGHVTISNSMMYDGVLIVVKIMHIDGEGGTLGYAGPCKVDDDGIPRLGVLVLDEADVYPLMEIGEFLLEEVVMHEIAHILGFGTLWVPNVTYTVPAAAPNAGYRYNLQGANLAHIAYGGPGTGALVEDYGEEGDGTTGSHWKEGVYGNELMTGFIAVDGALNVLSRITLGGLEDIGFSINYNHPDLYEIPEYRRQLRTSKKIHHVNDTVNFVV